LKSAREIKSRQRCARDDQSPRIHSVPKISRKPPFAGDKRSNHNANSEIAKHQVEREVSRQQL
jgi:hypothetical protein